MSETIERLDQLEVYLERLISREQLWRCRHAQKI